MNATARLASLRLPGDQRLFARALLDTWACAMAARDEPAAKLALRHGRGRGPASLWHADARDAHEEDAAWANGVIGHVLDYDDVASAMRGHPSIAMLPAIMALAETEELTLADCAAAYATGLAGILAISRAMVVEHYARGWHSTATIGAIGATLACCTLLRLPAAQTEHAIGLAVAQAAGTRLSFGTMGKAFQAGQANLVGLRSARLAQLGFDAAPDALDAPMGLAALYGTGAFTLPDFDAPLALEVKKYPMCYATHRALDALLDLRAEHGLTLDAVRAVHVRVSAQALAPLIHHRPRTGLDAKFSMEYAVAAALHDGAVRLSSFTDAAVNRPAIQAFFPRVTAEEAPGALLPRFAELTIHVTDGRVLTARQDVLRGGEDAPLSDAELCAKADDCLGMPGAAATMLARLLDGTRPAGLALQFAMGDAA